MSNQSDFRQTWLWRHAFVNPVANVTAAEQEYFRERFLAMRDKAGVLVSHIAAAMPGLTVHDLTHLDALWDTASLVAEGALTVSPAEAFVFGASVLLHDSAMSLAAYPNGLSQLKDTIAWKDTVTALLGEEGQSLHDVQSPPSKIEERAIPEVLRQLHAEHAFTLATQSWPSANGEALYLIDDAELRYFYGDTIGKIAHSHWWSISKVEKELSVDLGAFPSKTKSPIDRIKIACLLRIADALHLDQGRAPRFSRALANPQGVSKLHWNFQEKLASPRIEHEAIVFTSAMPFSIADADSWWLAYDTISAVDKELRDVELLLQAKASGLYINAKRVKGAGSPEALAKTISTSDWRPIDTKLQASDIPKIIETLGGAKLYGDDPTVVLRELIQNSSDAIQARRRYQNRSRDWGEIKISLSKIGSSFWLSIEDNGIGMSERVMTGPLIDFGTSFWRSSLASQEFPGLISKGMNAVGRFGIGFFSVFMIGSVVRVISRRFDQGIDAARVLEFRDGTSARPILSSAKAVDTPIDGGTRIEIQLKINPSDIGGILNTNQKEGSTINLKQLVASIAPNVDASIITSDEKSQTPATTLDDWLKIEGEKLIERLNPLAKTTSRGMNRKEMQNSLMRTLKSSSGEIFGRAHINPTKTYLFDRTGGWITIGGLRSKRISNIEGLLLGETLTASRNSAIPIVGKEVLAEWATEQASLISKAKIDPELMSNCAEVVLECGGRIGNLPIIRFGGNEWLNSAEFRERLSNLKTLTISLDGDFSYDEDDDDVHPKEFRVNFRINPDIAFTPDYNGSIINLETQNWPRSITGVNPGRDSNLAAEVVRIIHEEWGDGTKEYKDRVTIGTVDAVDIIRYTSIFDRPSAERIK